MSNSSKTIAYFSRHPKTGKLKLVRGWWVSGTDAQGMTTHFKHNPKWDGSIEQYMSDSKFKVKPIFND